jgi:hypothetical protein
LEQGLAARYGTETSFRHLAHLDPAQLLTERRFRWADGLPWESSDVGRSVPGRPVPGRRSGQRKP